MTTENLLQVVAKTIKGTSFVGITAYESSKNAKTIKQQVANFTFLVGFDYSNYLKKQLRALKSFDLSKVNVDNKELLQKVYDAEILSLEKRLLSEADKDKLRAKGDSTIKRSDAQKQAYTHLAKGLKALHTDRNGNIYPINERPVYIFGLQLRKTIIVKGEYKPTKHQQKTIIKNALMREVNKLDAFKYQLKNFKIGQMDSINLQGAKIG